MDIEENDSFSQRIKEIIDEEKEKIGVNNLPAFLPEDDIM